MNKGRITGLLLLLLMAAATRAAEPDPLGQRIASQGVPGTVACMSCHGPDGLGNAAVGAPMLAGMNAGYLQAALQAFREQRRYGPTMTGMVANLTPEQMEAVANYYAALPAAPKKWEVARERLPDGEKVVREGMWDAGVPPCITCHGQNAEGVGAVFPRLSGQLPAYLEARLVAWREQQDQADTPNEALMAAVARKLSPEAAQAASAWLAAQSPDMGPSQGYQPVDVDWPPALYNVKDLPEKVQWEKAQAAYERQQKRMQREDAIDHTPPPFSEIPQDEEGEIIRFGRYVFSNTQVLRGSFVGNGLACANCHMAEGASVEAAPIWATSVDFPQFRNKNRHVNTMVERIAGCFMYSMNGTAPPAQHKVMVGIESYMKWLSRGIPSDAVLKVRGYQYLPLPEQTPDYARGERVYEARCAVCHAADGGGVKSGERVVFPPVWGPDSFNWGAGMHTLEKAAGFVKANMPLGNPDLTVQETWDVVLFINSHERPQDPRWKGDVKVTRNAHHNHVCTYGLETANGVMGDTGDPLPKPDPVPFSDWATSWQSQPTSE